MTVTDPLDCAERRVEIMIWRIRSKEENRNNRAYFTSIYRVSEFNTESRAYGYKNNLQSQTMLIC
jgi:hypothetical protein